MNVKKTGPGPCVRRHVVATIVTPSGMQFQGTNHCLNAQTVCPRAHLPSGEGFEFCRDVCEQQGHAEIMALANAALTMPHLHLKDSACYVDNHHYVCGDCIERLHAAGIQAIVLGKPPTVQ